jgi:hypothetical protein
MTCLYNVLYSDFVLIESTNMDSTAFDQDQKLYTTLSIEHVKRTNTNKSICFSLPRSIGKLLGEVFLYEICDKFNEFLSNAFGINKDLIKVEKQNKTTSKFDVHFITIKSSSPDFIINNSGIIARRILQDLVVKNPEIIFKSGSHMSKKTKAMESDKVIDMVNDRVIKSIMDDLFIGIIKATKPSIEFVEIPHKANIYKRYGKLYVSEYLTHIMVYQRHIMFNYRVRIYDNLNISGDNESAKSNIEFVDALFDSFINTNNILVIVSKTENKIIIVSNEDLDIWDRIFTMCSCFICGENFISQNMLPINDTADMCIVCAKHAQSAREVSFETLQQIPCYSGNCGVNGTMFYMFRQGVYISDKDGYPIKVSDARLWKYRGVLFMKYLESVVHPKYMDIFSIEYKALPDVDTASIMYDTVIDRLDTLSATITKYIDEVTGIQHIISVDDFLKPFRDLLTKVNVFKTDFSADKSPSNILEKSKYTGELIRQFGIVYFPTTTDVNSFYMFNFKDVIYNTLPRGIILNDAMTNMLKKILDLLEEVRCYSFCDHCKNFMMKIDACDTGNCTICAHSFCMEHGTMLTSTQYQCGFERKTGGKCVSFFHNVPGGFRWDSIPAKFASTCVCKLY